MEVIMEPKSVDRFGLILFYHKIYIDNNAYDGYNEIILNESKK